MLHGLLLLNHDALVVGTEGGLVLRDGLDVRGDAELGVELRSVPQVLIGDVALGNRASHDEGVAGPRSLASDDA